jgi:hypothetical protein
MYILVYHDHVSPELVHMLAGHRLPYACLITVTSTESVAHGPVKREYRKSYPGQGRCRKSRFAAISSQASQHSGWKVPDQNALASKVTSIPVQLDTAAGGLLELYP